MDYIAWAPLVLWSLYSLLVVFSRIIRQRFCNYYIFVSIPNVFVTFGILGTFIGIVYGLYGLKIEDLQKSLPIMIDGLKTAFWTSIAGIIGSVVMRTFISKRIASHEVKVPQSEESRILNEISKAVARLNEVIEKLSIDERTRNLGLIRTMENQARMVSDRVDALADRMAQANTDAIVGALEKVITDFNNTFQNLIGALVQRNFDSLTNAIDQLIQWQQTYREDVMVVRASYQEMLHKFTELVEHGEQWVKTMDSVAGSGSALQKVVDEFNLAFHDNSRFRQTLESIHAATRELKEGTEKLNQLGVDLHVAAEKFGNIQDQVANWATTARQVAAGLGDLQNTLAQLREFDISHIPVLEEHFKRELQQTMQSLDDLVKSLIEYVDNKD